MSLALPLGVKRTAVRPARATRSVNDGCMISLKTTVGAAAAREVEHTSMRMGPAAPGIWCEVRVGVATQPVGSAGGRSGLSPAP